MAIPYAVVASASGRFTTYERIAKTNLMVVKRDGRRNLIVRSCSRASAWPAPLPVPTQAMRVSDIGANSTAWVAQVPSRAIGEMVIERLRDIDQLAYALCPVYRSFPDLGPRMSSMTCLA